MSIEYVIFWCIHSVSANGLAASVATALVVALCAALMRRASRGGDHPTLRICHKCRHIAHESAAHQAEPRCAECGLDFSKFGAIIPLRSRRNWWLAAAGTATALALAAGAIYVRGLGPISVMRHAGGRLEAMELIHHAATGDDVALHALYFATPKAVSIAGQPEATKVAAVLDAFDKCSTIQDPEISIQDWVKFAWRRDTAISFNGSMPGMMSHESRIRSPAVSAKLSESKAIAEVLDASTVFIHLSPTGVLSRVTVESFVPEKIELMACVCGQYRLDIMAGEERIISGWLCVPSYELFARNDETSGNKTWGVWLERDSVLISPTARLRAVLTPELPPVGRENAFRLMLAELAPLTVKLDQTQHEPRRTQVLRGGIPIEVYELCCP